MFTQSIHPISKNQFDRDLCIGQYHIEHPTKPKHFNLNVPIQTELDDPIVNDVIVQHLQRKISPSSPMSSSNTRKEKILLIDSLPAKAKAQSRFEG